MNRGTNLGADGLGVLQGGAVNIDSTGHQIGLVPTNPPIPNEFGKSNVANTIAMALTGSNVNSATNQFFFNTVDNSSPLNPQKFSVFGQLDPASDAELAALAATPTHKLTNTTLAHDFPPAGFNQVPLNNYNGSAATFPGDARLNNYIVVTSTDVLKRDEYLMYKAVSSNPNLVTASVHNEFLTLNAVPGKTGTARIRVTATDLAGKRVVQILKVTLTAAPVITGVTITPDQASPVTTLTANPIATPSSGVTFTYQWFQNGFPIPITTQTFNLTTFQQTSVDPTNNPNVHFSVKVGDRFTVQVTPTETAGSILGATFTSDPVTIATAAPDPITLVP